MKRELKVEVRRYLSQHDVKYHGERQIDDARVGIDRDIVAAEAERITEDQGREQEYRGHRDTVEVEVLERNPERVRDGPLLGSHDRLSIPEAATAVLNRRRADGAVRCRRNGRRPRALRCAER